MAKAKLKIKKGDNVIVTTGRDKGATGEVLRVLPEQSRVIVQGINMVKKHKKPTQMGPGGIEEMEASIHVSNVAHVDPKDGKATRVEYQTLKDGSKVRVAKRSKESID